MLERPTPEQEGWYWSLQARGVADSPYQDRTAYLTYQPPGWYVRLCSSPDLRGYVVGPRADHGPALQQVEAWCQGQLHPPASAPPLDHAPD
jgi:hypothetical protein